MKQIKIDRLIISESVLKLDGTVDAFRMLEQTAIDCFIATHVAETEVSPRIAELVASNPHIRLLPPIGHLPRHSDWSARTVSTTAAIGTSSEDLRLADFSTLYFHVGPATILKGKVEGLIPLSEQGIHGLANVLTWIADTIPQPSGFLIAQHGDLVEFARRSVQLFATPGLSQSSMVRARTIARRLGELFPEILAVFGCGFPFYMTHHSRSSFTRSQSPPDSIRKYIESQAHYFRSKIVSDEVYQSASSTYSRKSLLALGLSPERDAFDRYEFEKEGFDAPTIGPSSGTLRDYVLANELDISSSIWPCHLCTELQNSEKRPQQGVVKNFERTCLMCHQTTLIPRNVGGVSHDLDLLAVVDTSHVDRQEVATKITAWVDNDTDLYRYDTDFPRLFTDLIGPLDLFVASKDDFSMALDELSTGKSWNTVKLAAIALWLPLTERSMEFGANFPLGLVPLFVSPSDQGLEQRRSLDSAQKAFADAIDWEIICSVLEQGSFYHRQLLSNTSIRQGIRQRMKAWIHLPEGEGGISP